MIAFPFQVKTKTKISFSGIFTQDSKKVVKIIFDNNFKPMEFKVDTVIKDPLSYIASKIQSQHPDKYDFVVDNNADKKIKIKHSDELINEKSNEDSFVVFYQIGKNIFFTDQQLDSVITILGVEQNFTLRDLSTIIKEVKIPKEGQYTKNKIVNRILFDNFVDLSERSVVNFVHSNYTKIKENIKSNDFIYVSFTLKGKHKSYKIVNEDYNPRSWEYVLKFNNNMYI